MSTVFETERLIVRRYTMDDFKDFFRMSSNEEVMRFIRPVQTRDQSMDFFQKILNAYEEKPGLGRWAMLTKDANTFVGSFAVIPVENSERIQLGYSLLKEYWGKGYATESTKEGIKYMFEKLGLDEIAGITFSANTSSQNVLLKNGFLFDSIFMEDGNELNLYLLKKANK